MKFHRSVEELIRAGFCRKGLLLPTVDSTNLFCKREFAQLPDGVLVMAVEQTRGRGRLGRRWYSPTDNLYASLVLKPRSVGEGTVLFLPHIAALAAFEVLRESGCNETWIKWPNDLYINDKKIGGVLGEGVFKGGELVGLVLGVGINLNMGRAELALVDKPATSVLVEKGTRVEVEDFATEFYERFHTLYRTAQRSGFKKVRLCWRSAASRLLNQVVSIGSPGEEVLGKVTDYGKDFSLVVETTGRTKRTFYSGDVSLRVPPEPLIISGKYT